jgi:hypothetical protein
MLIGLICLRTENKSFILLKNGTESSASIQGEKFLDRLNDFKCSINTKLFRFTTAVVTITIINVNTVIIIPVVI